MINIAIRNITMAGYLCKRFGLSGVSGEMMSLPFSVFVLIGDLGVCKIVAKIFFFVIVFYLFTLFTFLTGLTMNFMNYFTRGKPKSKSENNDLFIQNKILKKENRDLKEQLLESDNCYDIPVDPTPVNPTPADDLHKLCVVCLLEPADHVLLPCGHVCVCKRCAALVKTCPMCRADVSERKRVYFNKEASKNQFLIKL